MPFLLNNCGVRVTTTGTATTLALGTGVLFNKQQMLTFAQAGAVDGREYAYRIVDGSGWEIAVGEYNAAANTITRNTTIAHDGRSVSTSPLSLSGRAFLVVALRAEDWATDASLTDALATAQTTADAAAASASSAATSASAAAASAAAADPSSRVQRAGDTMAGALNWKAAVSVASASTCNIGAATSNLVTITGTTTITGFDIIASGVEREVRFSGALTLTHNATTLILPGAANIVTVAGDTATFLSEGSGNWRCIRYNRASGSPLPRGTATHVWTANGASSDPTFQAIPTVIHPAYLLATLTASNSGALVDTTSLTSAYDLYMIEIENLLPATGSGVMRLRVSKDGGANYQTTSYSNASATTDSIDLGTSVNATAVWGGVSGVVWLFNPAGTTHYKIVTGVMGGLSIAQTVRGTWAGSGDTSAINAIQITSSVGNLTSGKVRIWGFKTS